MINAELSSLSLTIGMLEQWNIGFWETAGVVHWQNPIDKEVNK